MKKINNYLKLIKKLITLVKPLRLIMLLAIIFGSIGNILATAIPSIGAYGVLNESIFSIKKLCVVLIFFALARSILRYLEQLCNHYVAFKVLEIIRDKIFRKLRELGPAKMGEKNSGELISIITSDIELLEVFYAHTISPVIIAILHTTCYMVVMYKFKPVYAGVLFLFHLLMAIVIPIITSNRASDIGDKQRKDISNLNSSIIDTFYGIGESTQYFLNIDRKNEMIKYTKKLNNSSKKLSKTAGENQALAGLTIMLGNIFFIAVSMYLFKTKQVNIDGLIIPIIIFMSSFGPVSALSNLANNLVITFACGERVVKLLDETPNVSEVTDKENINMTNLNMNNVGFSYDEEDIIKDLNLNINKGEILGLSGESGCGKSTILKLIMRFYDVNEGEILENKCDIKNINTYNLRENHTYITQHTHLFKGSILENLKVAKTDATKKEIIEACQKASIHDFIIELPEGYETKVETLGQSLSTGERQRIALARGFLQNGNLMLLDEPTSNIDSLNEGIILKSISEKAKDKAVIIVSHKLSTLRIANRIQNIANIQLKGRNNE